ncbi:MAG TPA: cytochrome c [Nitrospirales bacterium]|jgi:cytochrome c2
MRAISKVSALILAVLPVALVFCSFLPSAQAAADPAPGEKIYSAKRCAACHMIQGKGGKLGPPLSDVASKRDAQWLQTFLKNPKAINPESKMSPFKGTDEELESLVAYLLTLK